MGQKSSLGRALRAARRTQNITQIDLARRMGMSVSAICNLERGLGRVGTLACALAELNLELRGRALKAGPVGPALLAARQQRGLSRRAVARALRVSRNTLAVTESGGGLVQTLEAYAGVVGAGLYLAANGAPRSFYVHAGNASGFAGWETPEALADLLTEAVGEFDLDPCAATGVRREARIKARILLTVDDDGLSVPWRGTVFVNPPYGRSLPRWIKKCCGEAAGGKAVVIGLVPARPDTRWWHDHVAHAADVFMLRGRLRFGDGKQSAPFPSALIVWGGDAALLARLRAALTAWHVPRGRQELRVEMSQPRGLAALAAVADG